MCMWTLYIYILHTQTHTYMRGPPQNYNYLLESSPFVIQASAARWVLEELTCISVPAGIIVRGCIPLQWTFFEHSLNAFAHFMMDDLWAHVPILRWAFNSFWPKTAWPPPSLFTWSCLKWLFFASPEEKILKGQNFSTMEEIKLKTAETLKGIRINELKNCFEQWKKMSW